MVDSFKEGRSSRQRSKYIPDAYLYNWTINNLPDSKNFFITDVDMILRNRKGSLMLLEIKKRGATVPPHQRTTLKIIDQLIKAGLRQSKGKVSFDSWELPISYKGLHLLQFKNTTFEDGLVFFDNKQVTESQLIEILAMRD